jgi:hypothetical protein
MPGQEDAAFLYRGVPPQGVGFGSGQGFNVFETAGIAGFSEVSAEKASLRAQKSENAALGQKMPSIIWKCPSTEGRFWFRARLERF